MEERNEDISNARLLKPWPLRLFLKKISWLIIAVSGVALVVLIGFSVYGNNVGDLVISVDAKTVYALSLSETGEFGATDSTSLLAAEGIKNIRDSTYYYIPENIREGNGVKSDKENNHYFAYSFYLKNMSTVSVGYSATLKLDKATKGIDKAIRIMVLVEESGTLIHEKIYARPKDDGTPEMLEDNESELKKGYTTGLFTENEFSIFTHPATEPGTVQKYTVVMWLEGWDVDCNDAVIGGQLSMSLTFKIIESE